MMPGRPKYGPRRDDNDDIFAKAIESFQYRQQVKVFDSSRFPGMIDRLVGIGPLLVGFEIKRPGLRNTKSQGLTPGERSFPGTVYIVEEEDEILYILSILQPIAERLQERMQLQELRDYERRQ